MQFSVLISIIQALLWLMLCLIPLMITFVFTSSLVHNFVHDKQQKLLVVLIHELLDGIAKTGQWPIPSSELERQALSKINHRLILKNSVEFHRSINR